MIPMDGIMARATWAADPINTETQGLAVMGYNPVAYFQENL